MAKTTTYTIEMDGMKFSAPTQAEALAMAKEFRGSKPTSVGKGKVKDTAFTKADGTVVMTTAAQAAQWSTWKENSNKKSKEELAQMGTSALERAMANKEVLAWVKAHELCTAKDVKAQFPELKGLAGGESLRTLKRAAGLKR